MFLKDLLTCNKDWEPDTELIIVTKETEDFSGLKCRYARALYGDRQVLWFRDCVVMLF